MGALLRWKKRGACRWEKCAASRIVYQGWPVVKAGDTDLRYWVAFQDISRRSPENSPPVVNYCFYSKHDGLREC